MEDLEYYKAENERLNAKITMLKMKVETLEYKLKALKMQIEFEEATQSVSVEELDLKECVLIPGKGAHGSYLIVPKDQLKSK